jgi:hypothetical protein
MFTSLDPVIHIGVYGAEIPTVRRKVEREGRMRKNEKEGPRKRRERMAVWCG